MSVGYFLVPLSPSFKASLRPCLHGERVTLLGGLLSSIAFPSFVNMLLVNNETRSPKGLRRPVARKGYGAIAHEAKPNGLLIRGL